MSDMKKTYSLKRLKDDNRGVTLFEMIIVMAIIVILSGLIGFTIQYVHNANVQKAGETLAKAIVAARTTTMTKGRENGRRTLYSEGGKLYYTIGDSNEKEQISTQTINFYIAGTPVLTNGIAPSGQSPDGQTTIYFTTAGMLDMSSFGTNYVVFYKGKRCYSVMIYTNTGKVDESLFYY